MFRSSHNWSFFVTAFQLASSAPFIRQCLATLQQNQQKDNLAQEFIMRNTDSAIYYRPLEVTSTQISYVESKSGSVGISI